VLACAALLCPAAAAPAQQRAYATVAVKSLVLRSNKTVSRAVRTRRVEGLTVRARGDFCKGYPRLAVRVDSRRWSTLELTRQWRDYDLPLKLKTGRHVVEVRFANDRTVRGRCSRAVRIAELRLNPGAARRVQLGTALNWATAKVDVAYANAAVREFDAFTPENEMKMSVVEPEPGRFAFGAADQLVNFAMANGKQVRGHALVFDKQTPAWVARTLDANQVIGEMRDYIRAIVTRYKDRVHEWDVVNEAFDGNGRYRETFWYQRLGPRFVELAFQFAREADPTAKLYYNEYVAERPGRQRDAVYNLARNLKQRGLIDGVGLQMHTALQEAPTEQQLEDTMRLYQGLGIEVQITEMDVLAKRDGDPATLADRLAQQAGIYAAAARACEHVSACTRLTVWGVGDRYSWLGMDQLPLLLDADLQPKPALAAVQDALGH
jgi:endo-1,4-beta-xylanase